MTEVSKADKEALPLDVVLSIPDYLLPSIYAAFARHAAQARREALREAAEVLEGWLPKWEADWKKHDDNFWEGGREALKQSLSDILSLASADGKAAIE